MARLALVLLILLAALAAPPAGETHRARPVDSCGGPGAKLGPRSPPFGSSRAMATMQRAQRLLPFRAVVPAGRKPFRIYVGGSKLAPRFRQFGLVLRRSDRDWIMITEGPRTPAARFRQFAQNAAGRDPCGYDWSLTRLHGGWLALLVAEPGRQVVNFGAGRLQILLFGPPARFTRAKALTLASELARLAAR